MDHNQCSIKAIFIIDFLTETLLCQVEVPNDFYYFIFKKTMSQREEESWDLARTSELCFSPQAQKDLDSMKRSAETLYCMAALFLFLSVTLPQRKPSLRRGRRVSLKCRREIPCEGNPRLLVFWGSPHVIPLRDMSPHAGQSDGCTVTFKRLSTRGSEREAALQKRTSYSLCI